MFPLGILLLAFGKTTMTKFSIKGIFGAAVLALASPAFSAERSIVCEYKKHGNGGWLGDAALFVFDEEKGTAEAYDGVIDYMLGKPIPVKMARVSTQRLQFNWRVDSIPTNFTSGVTELVGVSFQATVNTKTMKSTMRAIPSVDVLNNTKATGACRSAK